MILYLGEVLTQFTVFWECHVSDANFYIRLHQKSKANGLNQSNTKKILYKGDLKHTSLKICKLQRNNLKQLRRKENSEINY